MKKLVPQSLRARLILSFGLLIFLSLFLAGLTTVYLLKEEQEKTARERLGRLAEPVALRAAILEAAGEGPDEIQAALEREYDVRILLVDGDATVVGDTGQTLRGQTIADLAQRGVRARPLGDVPPEPPPDARFRVSRYREGPNSLLLFTSPQGVVAAVPGPGGVGVPRYQAVIAVEESDLRQAWRDLLPRLFLVGGIALVVGVVAAGLLARSITRPLQQITDASEEMARGRYEQHIPDYGGQEVGRLARAFNGMAQQVSRSHRTLREFLANVSHELKTPLTSIHGFSQAMVDGSLKRPEDFIDAGRIINEESLRMRALVDDLLYLSQVEGGQIVMQADEVNPNDLLIATRDRFRRRAEQSEIELGVEPAPTPSVVVDPRRVEQAVANIVDNAIRHTPAGGKVTLRTGTENGNIRFSVHNTGSVIPAELLPRIFDRFFQVDPAKSRVDGNTGLGLAITKEIVEAHGGHMEVTSAPETGTEFVITLPVSPKQVNSSDGSLFWGREEEDAQ